jgi:hypothetical protein
MILSLMVSPDDADNALLGWTCKQVVQIFHEVTK